MKNIKFVLSTFLLSLCNLCLMACGDDNDYFLESPIDIQINEKGDTIKYANKKQIITDFEDLSYDNVLIEKAFVMEKHISNSFQGLAIHEDYLLQTYHTKQYIDVYDLTNNQFVFSMIQKAEGSIHCNNVDFGNTFYNETDPFPLLYLEYRGTKHSTGVYRIVNKTGTFELEKIQVLTFTECNSSITNNNLDTNEMYITYIDDNHPADSQSIARIKIPDYLSGNQTISINSSHIIEKINIERKLHQDGTIYKNKLFQLRGGSGSGELWIFDLTKHKTILTVDWNEVGMSGEPEGIGWYKDHLVITNNSGQVYNMYFVK